jgi:hypothetical protein
MSKSLERVQRATEIAQATLDAQNAGLIGMDEMLVPVEGTYHYRDEEGNWVKKDTAGIAVWPTTKGNL